MNRQYYYKGNVFQSAWTLAKYIHSEDNAIPYDDIEPTRKEAERYLQYIYHRYGKEYLMKFRNKRPSDFKRKVVEVSEIKDIDKYKHKNVRFHYVCGSCGRDVYATWHLLTHFNDNLCKNCRKNP